MINTGVDLNSKCGDCPVRTTGVCEDASATSLNQMAGSLITLKLPSRAIIVNQGDPISHLFIIKSGTIIVTDTSADGRHTIVDLISQGCLFGSVIDREARFSYEAASPVVLCMIPRGTFVRIIHEDTGLAFKALEMAQRRTETSQELLTLFNCRSSMQRLAGYLYALAIQTEASQAQTNQRMLQVPFKRKDLAAYLGTTPETLSRNFKDLVRRGIMTGTNAKGVGIINVYKLRAMVGDAASECQTFSQSYKSVSANKMSTPIPRIDTG
jgi:CRP/FNR family transcriptional regulator, anaerobic regulatory protein